MIRFRLCLALLAVFVFPLSVQATDAQTRPPKQLGLASMLSMVPATLRDVEDAEDVEDFYSEVTYAGISTQLASLGIEPPQDMSDDAGISRWRAAVAPLSIPGQLAHASGRPEDQAAWQTALGFAPFEVDEALGVGQTPAELLLLRGRFDAAAVEAAMLASGFQSIGDAIYHLEHVDLDSPSGRAVAPPA
jgi:hypothetical protein